MKRRWKRINTRIVYKSHWLTLREDTVIRPDGKKGKYSIVERMPVNIIIALDDDESIYFIKEYRYPIKKTIIQLPAGISNRKVHCLLSAKQELYEETGIRALEWKKLGLFYIGPGHESIYANLYLATKLDLSQLNKSIGTGEELIFKVAKLSLHDTKKLIISNKIECGITLAALSLFLNKYKGGIVNKMYIKGN